MSHYVLGLLYHFIIEGMCLYIDRMWYHQLEYFTAANQDISIDNEDDDDFDDDDFDDDDFVDHNDDDYNNDDDG